MSEGCGGRIRHPDRKQLAGYRLSQRCACPIFTHVPPAPPRTSPLSFFMLFFLMSIEFSCFDLPKRNRKRPLVVIRERD